MAIFTIAVAHRRVPLPSPSSHHRHRHRNLRRRLRHSPSTIVIVISIVIVIRLQHPSFKLQYSTSTFNLNLHLRTTNFRPSALSHSISHGRCGWMEPAEAWVRPTQQIRTLAEAWCRRHSPGDMGRTNDSMESRVAASAALAVAAKVAVASVARPAVAGEEGGTALEIWRFSRRDRLQRRRQRQQQPLCTERGGRSARSA